MQFADRRAAGAQLAERCAALELEAPVVLALPRGGVPVAFEVARRLDAPLDIIVVRKLGVPRQPELAMGAIGEGDARVLNDNVVRITGVTSEEIDAVERRERAELARRVDTYRGGRPPIIVQGRTAFVIDDGIATGSTARAACQVVREQGATRVVLAAPMAPVGTGLAMLDVADAVVVVEEPPSFYAIGEFYRDFSPTSDAEVVELLERARNR